MQRKMLLAGGTGLIGSAIRQYAAKQGWTVDILSRQTHDGHIHWDPRARIIALDEPRYYDAIINLAGASIAGGRWTASRKKDILESRLNACATIEAYMDKGLLQTGMYAGASAIGIYGDRGEEVIDDYSPLGPEDNWMANIAKEWEEAHLRIASRGVRTVILRIGIVLSREGGALPELLMTSPAGVVGYFGNGQQYWPWIHIDDVVRIFMHAVEHPSMHGTYLTVAPFPVSNKTLSTSAARAFPLKKLVLPVHVFALTLLLGEMKQMLLQSCKGFPGRLLAEHYDFLYRRIDEAMHDLIGKKT